MNRSAVVTRQCVSRVAVTLCWIFISSSLSRRQRWPHGYATGTRTRGAAADDGPRPSERAREREREVETGDDGPRPDRSRSGPRPDYLLKLPAMCGSSLSRQVAWQISLTLFYFVSHLLSASTMHPASHVFVAYTSRCLHACLPRFAPLRNMVAQLVCTHTRQTRFSIVFC